MISPLSGSAPDHPGRYVTVRAAESYPRSPVQGGVFKTPKPPQHQLQPELFGLPVGGGRRDPSRPPDLGFALPQSQDSPFPSSPLSGLGSPQRSPYAPQTSGSTRLDYCQQITDPFAQQSPLISRPSPDPYANTQTPGTPRPHSDPTYLNTPPALCLDQYSQPTASRHVSPSHPTFDPYASSPGTPRPAERFPRSPGSQRSNDPYSQPPGTPRPSSDPYTQQPSTPKTQKATETFSRTPVETCPLQPVRSPLGPGLCGETVPFTPTHHQVRDQSQSVLLYTCVDTCTVHTAVHIDILNVSSRFPFVLSRQQSPGRQQQQDSFLRTPSGHTPKHPGMSEDTGFPGLVSQPPGQDPFEHDRMTTRPSQTDKTAANDMAALGVASFDEPMSMLPQLGDSEDKLRQVEKVCYTGGLLYWGGYTVFC